MLRIYIIFFMAFSFISGCSNSEDEKDRFINAYKDILVVRERFQDSIKANKEVQRVYKKYNYTKESFLNDWKSYTCNPEEFLIMMDTIRQRAERELFYLERKNIKEKN